MQQRIQESYSCISGALDTREMHMKQRFSLSNNAIRERLNVRLVCCSTQHFGELDG
jgi:hypothetical protein